MVIQLGYPVQGFPLLCHLSEPHVHINGKGASGVVVFTTAVSQSTETHLGGLFLWSLLAFAIL